MKILLFSVGSLLLPALLLAAPAQATRPAPASTSPLPAATPQRTADRRAATYTGPKVVKDTKRLGREFIHDSKPAPARVSPVKR